MVRLPLPATGSVAKTMVPTAHQQSPVGPTRGTAASASASSAAHPTGALAWLERMRHVTGVLCRHAVSAAADRLGWHHRSWRGASGGLTGPMRFRVLLEDLGGSFVKFGQVLAVQPDLLPAGYATQLL